MNDSGVSVGLANTNITSNQTKFTSNQFAGNFIKVNHPAHGMYNRAGIDKVVLKNVIGNVNPTTLTSKIESSTSGVTINVENASEFVNFEGYPVGSNDNYGYVKIGEEIIEIENVHNLKQIKSKNNSFSCEFLINCAGLFSDEIARMDGMSRNVRIIPFRGEYYKIRNTKNSILNNMIYPLADPDLPFLGIHLTKTANGDIEAGPNAVLAFSKEGYKWTDINFVDLTKVLTYPGMIKLGKKYLKTGLS